MASPDVSQYVDLSIYDKDVQGVFEVAVDVIKQAMPEWVPEEGNTEVILLEAMAQEVVETIYAINRLPGAVTQVLLQLYGVNRDMGSPPLTTVHVSLVDSLGHDILAGTRFLLNYDQSLEPLVFTTTQNVIIAPGVSVANIPATGDLFTDTANGIIAGTSVELLDAIPYVDYANLNTAVSGGRSEEDDSTWLSRSVARLSRLADTMVIPKHFTAAAIEYPFVARAFTLDNYNYTNVGSVPGDAPGNVTVAVYGPLGTLTTEQKTQIDVDFEKNSLANLEVHIMDPAIVSVNVTTAVVMDEGFIEADVIANVQAVLQARLNPSVWDWSSTLYQSDLISIIASAVGVARVTSVTLPAGNFALTGAAPLIQVGTIIVTAS